MLKLLIEYLGGVVNVVSTLVYASLIIKDKIKIKKSYLIPVIIIESIILQSLYLLKINMIKTFIAIFMSIILFKITYKIDNIKAIILSFFHFILEIIADISTILIFLSLTSEEFFYNKIAGGIISNISVAIIMILLTIIFRKLLRKIMNIKYKNGLIITSILTLICMLSIFYSTYNYGTNSIDNILGFTYMAIISGILFRLFIQEYNNYQLANEYDNLLTFIKKYEIEIDNQRTIRHESKNQLLTIKSKIIDKDEEKEIINYIDEVLKDNNKTINHYEYAKLKYLPSNGLRGLFYYKLSLAQDKNINIEVNISKQLEKSFLGKMNIQDFNQICKVLGIYLDNAIEASIISNAKKIGIEIIKFDSCIEFIISNTFNNKINKNGESTKGIGRGHGLILANRIINNSKLLESTTEINNDLYTKKLTIKKE